MIYLRRGISDRLLDAVWLGLCDVGQQYMIGVGRAGLAFYLFPFTVIGGYDDQGRCVGAVWYRGKDIHIALAPDGRKRWATAKMLRQFFRAFFEQSDEAEVFVNTEDGHRFVTSLGFSAHETTGSDTRYTLRPDHARFL
jgi:hypothetical protein